MIERQLQAELESAARRLRQLAWRRNLAIVWLGVFAVGVVGLLIARWLGWSTTAWGTGTAATAAIGAVIALAASRRTGRDLGDVARAIEKRFPELDDRLLAAVEQRRSFPGELGYLQEQVILESLQHARRQPWDQLVAPAELARTGRRQAVAFAAMALGLTVLALFHMQTAPPVVAPGLSAAGVEFDVAVEPGDASVERGTDLLVTARYRGPLPAAAILRFQTAGGETQSIPMTKSLDDPLFGGRIIAIRRDGVYRIESDGVVTPQFRIAVFDYPRLERADARLQFPAYTGLKETTVEDTERVTAVEGTKVTLVCRLNKSVAAARLVAEDGTSIALAPSQDGPAVMQAAFPLQESRRLELELVDEDGRKNKHATHFSLEAVPNRRPELKVAFPGRDTDVSPLQEVALEATAWDDFGLEQYGVTYTLAGKTQTLVLGRSSAAGAKQTAAAAVPLEPLGAQPDDLLSYHFWAEDVGPDGAPRRTDGDLYFAEVRRFEEIFRQGEQPPGGQMSAGAGGTPQEALKLAELQKQIIAATWKLLRRESAKTPDEKAVADAAVVRDSQKTAAEQARALQKKLKSPEARKAADEALAAMTHGLERLERAAKIAAADPLREAVPFEQSAYQALLKLRAREHRVVQGQQGGGGGGGGSAAPSQQQLQQLKLDSQKNRYETQRAAKALDNPAERENRQILNRLKELAQRQHDVNQRLKDLQAALEEAKTDSEREALRRELKRLREEQQNLLRDVDELRQRTEQAPNQSDLAEARQQLNQTRDNVRRSSQALEKEMVPQALSAGTRAERELQQLRDDFRKRLSGRFGEAMQAMRQEARELAGKQNALERELQQMDRAGKKSLRDSGERKEIAEGLEAQKGRLGELLENVRQVTEQAETSEPLLSRQLYDTYRKTVQQKADEALAASAELLRRGFPDDARQVTPKATKAIGELKEGVERAANSVLGDEAEALRLARSELDALAEALRGEIERAQPDRPNAGKDAPGKTDEGAVKAQAGKQAAPARQGKEVAAAKASGTGKSVADRAPTDKTGEGKGAREGTAPGKTTAKTGQSSAKSSGSAAGQDAPGQKGLRGDRAAANAGSPAGKGQSEQQSQDASGDPTNGGTRPGGKQRAADLRQLIERGGFNSGPGGPITGPDSRNWSDRLRDVEELLEEPALRSQAAEIRERVRDFRAEFQRHSQEPHWPLVEKLVARPLDELRQRVAEELARRERKDSLVPIDRDPVPVKYSELVRRYYETLGEGK